MHQGEGSAPPCFIFADILKAFSCLRTLRRHQETHSGERPFKCPYQFCQKRFTRCASLRIHLQKYHECTRERAGHLAARVLQQLSDSNQHSNNSSTIRDPAMHISSQAPVLPETKLEPLQEQLQVSRTSFSVAVGITIG